MADSVISFVLDHLSLLLAHEAKLLCGVENSIKSLHNELQLMNDILKGSKNKKGIERTVVNQIRDVSYLAEDLIDTYVAKVSLHKRRAMLGRMLHGFDQAKLLHEVADEINNIKSTISDIHDNKIKYQELQESTNNQCTAEEDREKERLQALQKLRRNVEEEDVVGFVHDSKEVITQLLEGGSCRDTFSIIGMGGLGKTTLARKVYNSNQVKQHFDSRVWLYVSNECRARDLLLGLVKHLMPNLEYKSRGKKKGQKLKRDITVMNEEELKKLVRQCLERKRYLVVLDDLWKKQDWDQVEDAFPDDNTGSRILITSRLKEVASHTSRHPPYYLQFLNEEESWELFCKKVFRGEEYPCDLEPLGKQIVQSCRGLPLSIVVLAGLLAYKEKSHREWSKVVGHVNSYLISNETQVKDIILKLSYDNLPTRLKPCFLYLGIFPEDFEIPVRSLLRKWVAEGFIQEIGNRDPDDVAEDYLYELIDRSLVQVARVKTRGGVRTCRIHDLLRDLCMSESKEDKVFEVCTDHSSLASTKPRRLSIHYNMGDYISSSNNDHSCVRSLFFFGQEHLFTPRQLKRLFKCFKLVRVLELGAKSCGGKIPSNLGDFIHLRYLRIDSYDVSFIPTSILSLKNLQTIALGHWLWSTRISFPAGIWKLNHLRHLSSHGPIMLRGHCSGSNEVIWNLQSITLIVLNTKTASLIKKVRLPNLKKLGFEISSDLKGRVRELLQSLHQLSHLNKLSIRLPIKNGSFQMSSDYRSRSMEWNLGCKPQELLESLGQLNCLTTLLIENAFDLLTCAITFPPNITKLTLMDLKGISDEGMHALENHTKLRVLKLLGDEASSYYDLHCVAGGFPQLQVFHMKDMRVGKWKLSNGAMLRLQSLVIEYCYKLHDLPNELWSLSDLRKVRVRRPSRPMAGMLRNLDIKDGLELIVEDH